MIIQLLDDLFLSLYSNGLFCDTLKYEFVLIEMGDDIMEITVHELKEKLDEVRIIDVREAEEFAEGHVPNAVNVPLGAFIRDLKRKGEELVPKDKEVVVYCGSGVRGGIAASFVQEKGWDNVKNLTGGYAAWTES